MTLSIHFECGLEYNGPLDRKVLNELAERYFANFIVDHKEMEWCDVIIYDKPRHDIGAKRNPPPLPHKNRVCETCGFACENYRVDEGGIICCNPEKVWQGKRVLPTFTCNDWLFDDDYYFRENEK